MGRCLGDASHVPGIPWRWRIFTSVIQSRIDHFLRTIGLVVARLSKVELSGRPEGNFGAVYPTDLPSRVISPRDG